MKTKRLLSASQVLMLLLLVGVVSQTRAVTTTDLIICEDQPGTIDCSPGTINIVDAQYGRSAPGSVACPHSSILTISCTSEEIAFAQGLCQGSQSCTLRCSFGYDPCLNTYKYLNVTYSCNLPETTTTATTPVPTTEASTARRVVVENKTERTCTDDKRTVKGELRCRKGTDIVITWGYCLGFEECEDFDMSYFALCGTDALKTDDWNGYCVTRDKRYECDLSCRGECPQSDQSGYFYAEYQCVGDASVVPESTTIATTTLPTIPAATTSAPTYAPTTVLQTTTPSTTPAASTAPAMTTNAPSESTPAATTKASSPEAVFEEFLAECFGNATSGEVDVKPYRPLTFTSPGEDADSRLTVNFQSASLQSKPVKLAIASFSEPSQADGCGSVPALQSNDTNEEDGDDVDSEPTSAASSRAINSVVDVTVYCFSGAPLQLKDGEYVDVIFPAKIDFENEVPVCTSMRGAASDWKWTTDGCEVVYSNYTHVTCRCNHLAAIALERGPKGFVVGHVNTIALLLIEKILGGISIICLLVVVMVYFILGNQRSQLAKIQLNIVMSCCFAHVMYLIGMQATGNLYACAVIATILQYLFTVYATWLVVQTALFLNTCYIHGKTREGLHAALIAPKTYNLELVPLTKIFLAVWGLPVAAVGIMYKEYPYAYGTPESCWLVETETPYKIFVSTIVLGLLVNITLSIITAICVVKIDRVFTGDDEDYEEWTERLRGLIGWCLPTSVVLSFVLVLAWVLHAVYQTQSSLVLDYLFNISIMSQGILVFLFYCVFNPQLRTPNTNQQDSSDNKTPDECKED